MGKKPTILTKPRNKPDLAARILKIGRECAALPVLDRREPEDMLYDKSGLPNRRPNEAGSN